MIRDGSHTVVTVFMTAYRIFLLLQPLAVAASLAPPKNGENALETPRTPRFTDQKSESTHFQAILSTITILTIPWKSVRGRLQCDSSILGWVANHDRVIRRKSRESAVVHDDTVIIHDNRKYSLGISLVIVLSRDCRA